jgi:hypothetical protein
MVKSDPYISKSNHNIKFNENIDSGFSDWKVTAIFYVAIHYIKSYDRRLNIELKSHADIFKHIDPSKTDALLKLPEKLFSAYEHLYRLSISSRYDGIENFEKHLKSNQQNYIQAIELLKIIKEELNKQGLKID